ncbi:hypothetical protein HID58_054322 [Brassica napus]|uniref:Uncharacterized protein n=1 Tax=Brassica napus TaxID=3708 RepID=A0ABQ8AI52_BRANA|nr:hypothetical protein HID58_054322 [Brassica napus]
MWYLCQFSNNKIENLLQKICFHIYHFTKDNNTLTLSSSPPSVSLPLPESPSFLSHRRITVISLSPSSSDVSLSPSSSGISLSPSTSGDGIYSKSPRCRLLYVIHNLQVKKPYLWMLSKGDKYTVRSLYDLLKKKARTMTRLERLSIGITIITEGCLCLVKLWENHARKPLLQIRYVYIGTQQGLRKLLKCWRWRRKIMGRHLRKKKKNKWKLIQKLRSPCKLKGRNEEEEIRNKSIRRMKRKEKMKRMRKLRRNFKMKMVPNSIS